MKRTLVLVLLTLSASMLCIQAAHAQLTLVAQKVSLTDTTISPADPSVLAINDSAEIMAIDVPKMPSSAYVLFSSNAFWEAETTTAAPVRALFRLRFVVSSPAMPPGVILRFTVPMADFRHSNNGNGESLEGGNTNDTEVIHREDFANFLLGENPGLLTEQTAAQVADGMFKQGFHVSISARLNSRNIIDATVTNPNVAFFAEGAINEQR